MRFLSGRPAQTATSSLPSLELSGPRLRQALETLVSRSEAHGGVERHVEALKLKFNLVQEALDRDGRDSLQLDTFMALCTFMSTVRRRVAPYLVETSFRPVREAIGELLADSGDTSDTDARMQRFCDRFPQDKAHRWVRDLAAELLHGADPERYPLMQRWVWDARANTGVIREIWFGDNLDYMTLPVEDGYDTYLALRQELSHFLSENGVFRDVIYYVDLLCAQVYADYICAQGGSYLRADFSSPEDPMQHTRRLLGMDGVKPGSSRTRLKSIDGEAFVLDDVRLLD